MAQTRLANTLFFITKILIVLFVIRLLLFAFGYRGFIPILDPIAEVILSLAQSLSDWGQKLFFRGN